MSSDPKIVGLKSVLTEYGWSRYALKEYAAASTLGRNLFEKAVVSIARMAGWYGDWFSRARYVCCAVRLLEGFKISSELSDLHTCVIRDAKGYDDKNLENRILQSYLKSPMARSRRNLYLQHGSALAAAMKFPRENDSGRRQGNLLVLKRFDAGTGEKGVLYLQYTESISSFVALFDLDFLCERYRIVVEPSSWGYQDDAFLLLIHPRLDVVILAQDEPDFEYVRSLKGRLHPLRIGAGDWIDPYVFSAQPEHKEFDFVMVASWSPVKRHSTFFSALAEAGLLDAPIALIGYPWEGRNQSHIEYLARSYGLTNVVFHERIPREEVAKIIRRSRVGVMLTRREGANRGVYECLFSGVPVVISRENRGFNKSHITAETGILASDDELPSVLRRIRDEAHTFKPREWALVNTGYRNAWRILNEKLSGLAIDNGEPYTKNIALIKSAPSAVYDVCAEQAELMPEYEALKSFIRDSV